MVASATADCQPTGNMTEKPMETRWRRRSAGPFLAKPNERATQKFFTGQGTRKGERNALSSPGLDFIRIAGSSVLSLGATSVVRRGVSAR